MLINTTVIQGASRIPDTWGDDSLSPLPPQQNHVPWQTWDKAIYDIERTMCYVL